ncbi:hypothetical protein SCARR_01912 [Pontiella sulfatireligans]|uniref:FAD/NAD(P)-binding domain-containing protein n=1 Tax=Pontiella sulfatireligans TaxID=2750658 RepID=A0A6C2UI10_9BACT|nr:hypothetical protein [Pontiella sulfatireligans]VGO19852.1 hypothetical protein SCARR_01912 [Pontiella sulfatireligans]
MRVVDTVIVAIGNDSNPLIRQTTPGLATNKRGNIVLGAATVILAKGEGRKAAAAMNEMLAM